MALELKGEQTLAIGQAGMWKLLNDPDVLAKTIPGCNAMRALGEDRYEMGLKLQVANVSGEYMGSVAITEKREPEHYVLAVEGQGEACDAEEWRTASDERSQVDLPLALQDP